MCSILKKINLNTNYETDYSLDCTTVFKADKPKFQSDITAVKGVIRKYVLLRILK